MIIQSTNVRTWTVFLVVLGLISAWTYLGGSCPGRNLDRPIELLLREGELYTVPNDQVAVITYLGADSVTITDVVILINGKKILSANETDEPGSTNVLVVVCGGSTVEVRGGLIEEQDALCRGVLVARSRMRLTCQ